jgi:hypothetical protein
MLLTAPRSETSRTCPIPLSTCYPDDRVESVVVEVTDGEPEMRLVRTWTSALFRGVGGRPGVFVELILLLAPAQG